MVNRVLRFGAISLMLIAASPATAWPHHHAKQPSNKQPIICRMVRVIDGDTAIFACPGWRKPQSTRFVGFNAPDICQPRYQEAKDWLQSTLTQGSITLMVQGRDKYQRMLAKVYVNGNRVHPPRTLTAAQKHCAWR